jgi:predicted Zn-dependent protease
MRKDKLPIFVTILLMVPFLAGGMASINPATEEEEIVFISLAKEKNMGRNIDKQARKHYKLPVDPLTQKRIEEIGERLAEGTDRKNIIYHFTVLNDETEDSYNAFAAPGGYVYIFDDLIEVMKTDDRIAAVLAHEMGHVEAKHSIKRLQGSLGTTLLLILGSQMSPNRGDFAAANQAIGQLMMAYSRHDERQADELSVKYMKRAGFDPEGTIQALKTLKGLRKKGPLMRYMYYKSHPYLSERVAHLKNTIKGYTDFDSYINIVPEKGGL